MENENEKDKIEAEVQKQSKNYEEEDFIIIGYSADSIILGKYNNEKLEYKGKVALGITKEEWDKVFAVDVYAPLYLTQLVAPVMKEKGKGVVINTCSVASYAAHFGFVGYISSKHAIAGLTKSMAFELGPEIRCNGIAPGAIHTAMVDSIGGVEALQMMVDGAPMKRVGQGEDIAALALFLASDESEFVDGQIIRCDGGFEC